MHSMTSGNSATISLLLIVMLATILFNVIFLRGVVLVLLSAAMELHAELRDFALRSSSMD